MEKLITLFRNIEERNNDEMSHNAYFVNFVSHFPVSLLFPLNGVHLLFLTSPTTTKCNNYKQAGRAGSGDL